MPATYLIRFDDLCPTMDRAKWAPFERLMDEHGIRPIIAIVPDNQDPKLMVDEPDAGFWEHMRKLQARGWSIALHGYQHLPCGKGGGMVPVHRVNEFVGLPEAEQRAKLEAGLKILREHGLEPTLWVAPRHGFDRTTVRVLHSLGIDTISDGTSVYPYTEHGVFWIPQQLWLPLRKKSGVWTCCFHANTEPARTMKVLTQFLAANRDAVTSVEEVRSRYWGRRRTLQDRIYGCMWFVEYAAWKLWKRVR